MKFLRRLRKLIKKYGSENVVYFDESGFVSHKGRLSGWAPMGQKLYADVKGKREERTNLLMAQRDKKLLAPFVFTGSCTAKTIHFTQGNVRVVSSNPDAGRKLKHFAPPYVLPK